MKEKIINNVGQTVKLYHQPLNECLFSKLCTENRQRKSVLLIETMEGIEERNIWRW